jgi:2-polyprenyl-3-methyl-5-hydroxy-6-metoxy-1,4-benzoquinol methylase
MRSTFYETVLPLVDGKTVLDVGSIGHSYSGRDGYKTWNFAVLAKNASRIKGFDLLTADIQEAQRDGFDIDVGDAETYIASEPYEVVFAGDLIEHLSNPGRFLTCCYQNLVPGGQLVLSTPNTYSFAKLSRVILRRTNEPPVNPEHTFYFTPKTLEQLVTRHGFKMVTVKYCELDYAENHGGRMKRAQLAVNAKLSTWIPRFSQTMVAVFEKV